MTGCSQTGFHFATESGRAAVARFDGGAITSDAGALLPHRTEDKTGIPRQLARRFHDDRNPERIEHNVAELVRQRVQGLALGYEDANDHDRPLAGKADIEGRRRGSSHTGSAAGSAAALAEAWAKWVQKLSPRPGSDR